MQPLLPFCQLFSHKRAATVSPPIFTKRVYVKSARFVIGSARSRVYKCSHQLSSYSALLPLPSKGGLTLNAAFTFVSPLPKYGVIAGQQTADLLVAEAGVTHIVRFDARPFHESAQCQLDLPGFRHIYT